jgi:hypothetical protein
MVLAAARLELFYRFSGCQDHCLEALLSELPAAYIKRNVPLTLLAFSFQTIAQGNARARLSSVSAKCLMIYISVHSSRESASRVHHFLLIALPT